MASNIPEQDIIFMAMAIEEAERAFEEGESPVGAVAVYKGKAIARARNLKEARHDPTAHAEIELIRAAARILGAWRLTSVNVYVTLEPCPMCAGALVQARVNRLVYGAKDPKMGAVNSLYEIPSDRRLNHNIEIATGVMADECAGLLTRFFKERRAEKQKLKHSKKG